MNRHHSSFFLIIHITYYCIITTGLFGIGSAALTIPRSTNEWMWGYWAWHVNVEFTSRHIAREFEKLRQINVNEKEGKEVEV
jgi:hypothetical protein